MHPSQVEESITEGWKGGSKLSKKWRYVISRTITRKNSKMVQKVLAEEEGVNMIRNTVHLKMHFVSLQSIAGERSHTLPKWHIWVMSLSGGQIYQLHA